MVCWNLVYEFTAQVSLPSFVLVVLFLAFCFLFHADDQIVFFVDVNVEVFFCHTGAANSTLYSFAVSNTLMAGGGICFYHPIIVKEIIKNTR